MSNNIYGIVRISYDASRGEEGCSNRQIAWPNRHVTVTVAKKKINSQFFLLYLRYMGGRWLAENVIWGRGGGWLKTSEYI